MSTVIIPDGGSGVFADYLDLRTAVIEEVGNADIADVFPRLVKMAEVEFNRRLRCREQMSETGISPVDGAVALPSDYLEALSLTTTAGTELTQQPVQAYDELDYKYGFYAIDGASLLAQDADYTFRYYQKIPTLTTSPTTSNWLLQKHPGLYLYAVSMEAEKHLRNVESAQALMTLREMEFAQAAAQDSTERFSRTRVRVAGVTP